MGLNTIDDLDLVKDELIDLKSKEMARQGFQTKTIYKIEHFYDTKQHSLTLITLLLLYTTTYITSIYKCYFFNIYIFIIFNFN